MRELMALTVLLALATTMTTEASEQVPSAVAQEIPSKPVAARGPRSGAMDRLELDTTSITGNRELPKVMYVVPWKRADIGDPGRPLSSLVDEVLAPVDREVLDREINYFRALQPGPKPDAETPVTAGERAP